MCPLVKLCKIFLSLLNHTAGSNHIVVSLGECQCISCTQGRVIRGSKNLNSCIIRVASYFISQKISWFLLFYHGLHRKVRDWGLDNRHLPYWMHALTRLLFLSYIVICCDIKVVKMVQTCSAYGCLNKAKKNSGINFHRFPSIQREALRKKWMPWKGRDLSQDSIQQFVLMTSC